MATFTVLDLEYTTWEGAQKRGWSGPNEHREVVQIGAVKADADTFEEVGALTLLVQPLRNPLLSDYFIQLTGITQAQLEREGIPFPDALQQLTEFVADGDIYYWGPDESVLGNEVIDPDALQETCAIHTLPLPFAKERFIDARAKFREKGIDTAPYSSATIVSAFGITPPDTAHNALSDARSVLRALQELRS